MMTAEEYQDMLEEESGIAQEVIEEMLINLYGTLVFCLYAHRRVITDIRRILRDEKGDRLMEVK